VALIGILGILSSGVDAAGPGPIPPSATPETLSTFSLPLGDNLECFLRAVYGTPRNARFLRLDLNIFGWARPIPENISKEILGFCLGRPVASMFVCGKDLVSGARNAFAIPED
jgi:hypothetical protein